MSPKTKTDISVIIPAYNEARRLAKTLKKISAFLKKENFAYEIIVVDDGSTDRTASKARKMRLKNVKVLSYRANRGKGYAVNYGVTRSIGRLILFADADNSTPIEELNNLLTHINEYPVVIASRYAKGSRIVKKQPIARKIGARFGNLLIRIILLPRVHDTQCGFKLFTREAAKEIFSRQTIWRWGFDIEILYIAKKLRLRIKEVPVSWYNDDESRVLSVMDFVRTLGELFTIKVNSLKNVYRR